MAKAGLISPVYKFTMDVLTILKKPFFIPSLVAGLIVAFRIFMLFFQYVINAIRRRKKEQTRKKARTARKKAGSDPTPPDSAPKSPGNA